MVPRRQNFVSRTMLTFAFSFNFIDIHYARAHLPILASVMMSRQVRHGDTIELPVPHPEAWPETVAFVYTGEEELATVPVRENIQHLGGKMW